MYKIASCPFSSSIVTTPPMSCLATAKANRYNDFANVSALVKKFTSEGPYFKSVMSFKIPDAIAYIQIVLTHLDQLEKRYPSLDSEYRHAVFLNNRKALDTLSSNLSINDYPSVSKEFSQQLLIPYDAAHPVKALFASAHLMMEILLHGLFPIVIDALSSKRSEKERVKSAQAATHVVEALTIFMKTLYSMAPESFSKIRPHLEGASGGDSAFFRINNALILRDGIRIKSLDECVLDHQLAPFLSEQGVAVSTEFGTDFKNAFVVLQLNWKYLFATHMQMALYHIGTAQGTDGGGVEFLKKLASLSQLKALASQYGTDRIPIILNMDLKAPDILAQVILTEEELVAQNIRCFDPSMLSAQLAASVETLKQRVLNETGELDILNALLKITTRPDQFSSELTRELNGYLLHEVKLAEIQFWCDARDLLALGAVRPPFTTPFIELHTARGRAMDRAYTTGKQGAVCEKGNEGIGCLMRPSTVGGVKIPYTEDALGVA